MKFISALNSLNTPWIAILVIVLGMLFDIACHKVGMSSESASGVVGAGIGLLTGQGLAAAAKSAQAAMAVTVASEPVLGEKGPSEG